MTGKDFETLVFGGIIGPKLELLDGVRSPAQVRAARDLGVDVSGHTAIDAAWPTGTRAEVAARLVGG